MPKSTGAGLAGHRARQGFHGGSGGARSGRRKGDLWEMRNPEFTSVGSLCCLLFFVHLEIHHRCRCICLLQFAFH